jgi:hypothetical protein
MRYLAIATRRNTPQQINEAEAILRHVRLHRGRPVLKRWPKIHSSREVRRRCGRQRSAWPTKRRYRRLRFRDSGTASSGCFAVVAHLGGDEFVIAAVTDDVGIARTSTRLYKAACDRNAEPGHSYPLHFSLGVATMDHSRPKSLKALIERAY